MNAHADPLVDGAYEGQVWDTLTEHWQHRNNRRGLPNWASTALGRSGEVAGNALRRVTDAAPEAVTEPMRRAGDAVADKVMRPALAAAAALLELVNDWAMELNDPKNVEKLARKQGFGLTSFTELRQQDLKVCDRLLSRNPLRWCTAGAFEARAHSAKPDAPSHRRALAYPSKRRRAASISSRYRRVHVHMPLTVSRSAVPGSVRR